jgi:hypothetical protein
MPLNILNYFQGKVFMYPASGPKRKREEKEGNISKFLSPSHAVDQKIWVTQKNWVPTSAPMAR